MKKLKDVMTTGVEIISPETSVQDIAKKMKRMNVGVLPVSHEKKLLGIVTDRDIVIRALADNWNLDHTTAQDVMTEELHHCYEDDSVDEAAKLMQKHQIRRLPVLDRNRELVGMFSLGDLATGAKDKSLTAKTLIRISEGAGFEHTFSRIFEAGTKWALTTFALGLLGAGTYWLVTGKSPESTNSSASSRLSRKSSAAA